MLLIAMLLTSLIQDKPWVEFNPKDGGFTAKFPQEPVERANRTGITWQLAVKDRVHSISKNPIPGGEHPSSRDIQSALNTVRDNLIKRVEAKLLSERIIEHHRIPAREYLFALPEEKGHLRVRCFVVKGHLWEIKVGGPKDYVAGKDADTFLEGLKIK